MFFTSFLRMSVEKLAECMGNNGIELSVISPQFLQPLRQIYLSANQNKTPTMNYAQDSRHLVYISGFPLPTGNLYSLVAICPTFKSKYCLCFNFQTPTATTNYAN